MVTCNPSILWTAIFFAVLSQISAEKTWRDYNLFVGPKSSETGRYIYETSQGSKMHCHYCEKRALLDSTYSHLQQKLCIRNYDGEEIDEAVLPHEKNETKYPLCNTGELPRCGKPPDEKKSKSHKWICDPGYSNILYSVYFSCGLICNVTDKVQWSYYCNESLQWEVERQIPWESCEVPVVVEEKVPVVVEEKESVGLGGIIGAASGGVVVIIIVILGLCYRRRKKARQDLNQNQVNQTNIEPADNRIPPQIHVQPPTIVGEVNPVNEVVVEDESVGGQSSIASSYRSNSDEENEPLLSHEPIRRDAGIGMDDNTSPDDGHRLDNQSDLEGAVGGEEAEAGAGSRSQTDPKHNEDRKLLSKEKPDIRVLLMKSGRTVKSIPLQNGFYSIEKGVDFAVVPNSPGGIVVKDFKIVRKNAGKSFRGNPLNFWFIISAASEDDAGLFMWHMRLENDEIFEGSFEISISLPDLPPREEPVGEENQDEPNPSIRNRVNPLLIPQQPANSDPHLDISSLLKNPKSNSLKINHNMQVIPVSVMAHTHRVNVEVHPELTPVATLNGDTAYLNLSSSFLRNDQNRPAIDSGLQTGERELNGQNSSRLGDDVPRSQSNHIDEHHVGNRIRSGNLTCTSGYESQRSAEIARERFNANFHGAPPLDIESLSSRASSARTHSGLTLHDDDLLSSRSQDHMLSTRPDPAGDSSPNQFTEAQINYDIDDPDQVHRKEVVESRMQQRLPENVNAAENRNNEGISPRLDYAEIPKSCGEPVEHEDVNGDSDSLSERLTSVPIQKSCGKPVEHEDVNGDSDSLSERLSSVPIKCPEFAILPQNHDNDYSENIATVNGTISPRREVECLENDIVEDSFVVNDDIIPRREIQISGESYEINVVTNGVEDHDSIRQDETKL